jgi:WD40 repeat protein
MVHFSFVGGKPIGARVAVDGWVPEVDGDVALLELDDDPPPGARPAPLRLGRAATGHAAVAFGYPKGHDDGVRSSPWIEGPARDGWLQVTAQVAHGHPIRKGFSGTGLFDTESGAVIGIVVARDRDPEVLGGFAIPVHQVRKLLPRLGEQLGPWLGWRLSIDEHLPDHWRPRARGVYEDTTPGWYFTGRRALLRELTGWLEQSPSDRRVRVVTGPAGAGKSAVLAWLCALSDPQLRVEVEGVNPSALAVPEEVPSPGRVSAAIWLRGVGEDEAARSLAAALEVPVAADAGTAAVLAALSELEAAELGRLVVVADALDEALTPREIARRLLVPLARDLRVKVLVGSRPGRDQELLSSLGQTAMVYRLDDPAWFNRQDLVEYAGACLRADGDPDLPSRYRDDAQACAAVAAAIAGASAGNFLVAGLAARARATEAVIDVQEPGWQDKERFPSEVGAAFEDYLKRLTDPDKARDLLRALAYAQGPGLPAGVLWAQLASSIAAGTRERTVADVDWLLNTAAGYLVETHDRDGEPVYRLFHQALIDHLAPAEAAVRNHRRITDALVATTALNHDRSGGETRNWNAAHPYARQFLATHAGAGGRLDGLLMDPRYLLAADPGPLLRALTAARDPAAAASADAYRQAVHHLHANTPPEEKASYLQLAGHQTGAKILAKRIRESISTGSWSVSWAIWQPPTTHLIAGRHNGPVTSVATTKLGDVPIVVSAGRDGTVRIWDLAAGQARGLPITAHRGGVSSVAVGEVDSVPVIVSGGWDGTLGIWDLAAGQPRGLPITAHRGGVSSVAVGKVDGVPVIVSGGWDGALRTWNLGAGTPRGEPLTGHKGGITSVATGIDGNLHVAVSGGRDGAVRSWDLTTNKPICVTPKHGLILAVATGIREGAPVVLSGNYDGHVRVWNLVTGQSCGSPFTGHHGGVASVLTATINDLSVAVTGGNDSTIRIWDLATGQQHGNPIRGHHGQVSSVAIGEIDDEPVVLSGGFDGTIRIWDPTAAQEETRHITGHLGTVSTVAVGDVRDVPVVVSGGHDGTIWIWDQTTGQARRGPLEGHGGTVTSVCMAPVEGVSEVVSGGEDGTVRIWDLTSGRARSDPLRGHRNRVTSVCTALVDGAPVAVSGGWDGTLRIWDLTTKEARGAPLYGHRDTVTSVCTALVDGAPVAVSGGWDGTLRIWDLTTRKPRGGPLLGHRNPVTSVCTALVDGAPVAVSGGWDGTVRIWDLTTRKPRGDPLLGHHGKTSAMAVGKWKGISLAVSGGEDGTVRLWDLGGHQIISTIDLEVISLGIAMSGPNVVIATQWGMLCLQLGRIMP